MIILNEGEFLGVNERTSVQHDLILSKTAHLYGETAPHAHKNDYFSILLSGEYLENFRNESILIKPGDIVYRRRDHIHKNEFVTDTVSCINIEISHSENETFFLYTKENKGYFYQLIVDFLLNKSFAADPGFFVDQPLPEPNKNLTWLLQIIGILHAEKEAFHTPHSLAQRVFVHPNYMARAFREKTGETIGTYQLKIKLNHAVQQLLNTPKTISDISFDNGFYDDAHFIRSFKKAYHISPLQFRKLLKS